MDSSSAQSAPTPEPNTSTAKNSPLNEKAEEPPPDSSNATVLVVEDEEDLLQVLSLLLEMHCQCRVLTASTGAEAVFFAKRYRPNLILLDLLLPDIDGWDVARLLRAEPSLASTSIVAVSEHCWDLNVRERAHEAGCQVCIHKAQIVDKLPAIFEKYVKNNDKE